MNIVDKVVSFFDPVEGRRRQLLRELIKTENFRFEAGSKRDRLAGWTAPNTGANAAYGGLLPTIRSRSRDLARNNSYANKAKRAVGTNTVGAGIVAQVKNKKSADQGEALEDLWENWALSTDCDAAGQVAFYGIQRQVIRTIFESGEVLIRRRRRRSDSGLTVPFQLQVLEGDYLDDTKDYTTLANENYIYKGIEFNKLGSPVAYYIYKEHPGEDRLRILNVDSVRVPASEIIHLFRVDRPGQIRGVPWMAPAVVQIRDFADYESAQLVRQKIAACYMAFIKDLDPDQALGTATKGADNKLVDKITPATIEILPAGRDITFANPPTVSGDYPSYCTQTLRGIAVGSGVPYEVLTSDYSQVNFSSARMSWLEFQRELQEWQQDIFTHNMLPRVWAWFTEYAAILGFDTDNAKVIWTPQRREMIDPTKEIKAARDEVRSGFNSLSNAIREQGRDPDDVFSQIEQDNARLDQTGIKLDTDPRNITQSGQAQSTTNANSNADPKSNDSEDDSADDSED